MGGVEDHRMAKIRHLRKRAHVRNQRVIAKGGAAFGQKDAVIAGTGDFRGDMFHVPRGQELALFHIDHRACRSRGKQQVGLPTQKGRNLQHIDGFGSRRALVGKMHIAQHRASRSVLHRLEDAKPLFHTDPARGVGRGAVRLVKGGFIDKPHAGLARHARQALGAHQRVVPSLNLAGTGDQKKRAVTSDRHVSNVKR